MKTIVRRSKLVLSLAFAALLVAACGTQNSPELGQENSAISEVGDGGVAPHCVQNVFCIKGTHWSSTDCKCVKDACVQNVFCIKGTHWSSTDCKCVKDACVQNQFCVRGDVWSSSQCKCVPKCNRDADCRLEADYCTGCNCDVLGRGQSVPACEGPGVRCFANPCAEKTVRCEQGGCVMHSGSAY